MSSEGKEEKAELPTFLATTNPGPEVREKPLDDEPAKIGKQKIRPSTTKENYQLLLAAVERLENKVSQIDQRRERETQEEACLFDNSLINKAQKRLRFDGKDVHGCIETWDHFFRLYNVQSDREKFFCVEQVLPFHIQKAMSSNDQVEISYRWLKFYLKQKYDPRYICHEMANRSVTRSTNLNELEDMATEAANNPKEQLVKHFMLQGCSQYHQQQMKPFLLLPLNEFKFKLKMAVNEDTRREMGQRTNRNTRVDAIIEEEFSSHDSVGSGEKPTTSATREFRRSVQPSLPGNYTA